VCLCIALAAYETMYPIMLIVPAALLLANREIRDTNMPSYMAIFSIAQTLICFCSALAMLLYFSNYVENSWEFLRSTYGFLLSVSDLAPNVGIFWYFFTEVFDHFRTFFVFVFQIHAFIYVAPMTIRLRQHPMFLAYSLLALSAVFRFVSYIVTVIFLNSCKNVKPFQGAHNTAQIIFSVFLSGRRVCTMS